MWGRLRRAPRPFRAAGGYLPARRDQHQQLQLQQQQQHYRDEASRQYGAAADTVSVSFGDAASAFGYADLELGSSADDVLLEPSAAGSIGSGCSGGGGGAVGSDIGAVYGGVGGGSDSIIGGGANGGSSTMYNAPGSRMTSRYRFRDLLLGDFAFNDDGER